MKANWLWLLLGLALVFGLALACASGDDDDDNNDAGDDDVADDDDNDAGDDDVADDDDNDDTGGGELGAQNTAQSDCLDGADGKGDLWDPMVDPIDVVQISWDDGVLKVEDLFAYTNCGFELEVSASMSGSVVTILENDIGTPADCICPFDFNYEITGIPAGAVTVRIERQSQKKSAETIFEMDLTLGDENIKWYVPYVEVFASGDTAAQPYQARIAACNLYHLEDQKFMVSSLNNMYHVFAYDWFDLDNPGEYEPTCQLPVMVEIGNLAAGTYYFGAPTFHDSEWTMLTFAADIE